MLSLLRWRFVQCLLAFSLAVFGFFPCVSVFAETTFPVADTVPEAVITASEVVPVGVALTLSAAQSRNPYPERPVIYSWNFGDKFFDQGEKVAHTFAEPGRYTIELTMQVGGLTARQNFPILVYERSILLVSDRESNLDQVQAFAAAASEKNVFLDTVWAVENEEGLLAKEKIVAKVLQTKLETLRRTNLIILWANPADALNGLAQLKNSTGEELSFAGKQIVVITDGDLNKLGKLARRTFAKVQPQSILLTRPDPLRDLLLLEPAQSQVELLEKQGIAYQLVQSGEEEFHITEPLSYLVNYLVLQGIPESVILLVLLLPVIATLVAFFKQVIGLTTFGVYTPSVLTLSFLAIGLRLGLIILGVVVLASVITRQVLRRYRLAYTPRLSIILSVVALAILGALVLLTKFAPLITDNSRIPDLITASVFPMLIMSTLAEKFVSIQTEKGARSAIRLLAEVMFVAVVCYLIVGKWQYLQTLILVSPEVILLFLVADVVLGRFTGLRFTEYFRFREVLKKGEEEE